MNDPLFAEPWLKFEKELGGRQRLHGDIDSIFSQWEQFGSLLQSKLTYPPPDNSVRTEVKEISPNLTVRIYTPLDYTGDKPVGLFFHGGGWALGDLDSEDGECRHASKAAGVVLVSVGYRLAPAHKYPAGLDDCVAAYYWALRNSSYLNTTLNQAFTFGSSAGGALAIGTALRVIDDGYGDTLKGIIALVPVTCHPDACPKRLKSRYTSYAENDQYTINSASAMREFLKVYGTPPEEPYTSPILHQRLKDMPRTYIVGAGLDTLRDDARLFKAALDDAGVPNMYHEYDGYPHWFWVFPSDHLKSTREEFWVKLLEGFKFILS